MFDPHRVIDLKLNSRPLVGAWLLRENKTKNQKLKPKTVDKMAE